MKRLTIKKYSGVDIWNQKKTKNLKMSKPVPTNLRGKTHKAPSFK